MDPIDEIRLALGYPDFLDRIDAIRGYDAGESKLKAEIERLRARLEIDPRHKWDGIACRDETIRLQDAEIERLRADLDAVASALPGVRYMDPPDGGSVSLAEQVRRMSAEIDMLRTGDTCARHCEGQAYRHEAQRLKRENERLKAETDNVKQVEFPKRVAAVAEGWRKKLAESQAREMDTWKALKKHHDLAMGKGRDMSHSLSKLIVSAYEQSDLCSATVNALSEDSRWPALDILLRAERAKVKESCAQVCLEIAEDGQGMAGEVWAERCADAIRALGDE